ncbi:UNVERIFIED_CONTAM: hypothetical protein RMT77_012326 [Armadillidium vulgare]
MGWSTGQVTPPRQESLTEAETKAIMDVIRKAEELDLNEQERVGRLVQKVEKMKQKRLGNGTSTCILCGGNLPLLRTSSLLCADCSKGVCSKCGVEVPGGKDTLWLCKICSETREMWKRSGAWFFRGLPKHVIPPKPNSQGNGGVRKGKNTPRRWNTIGAKGSTSEDNETSSEDETRRKIRMQKSNTEVPEIDNHDITKTEINISTPRLNKPTGIPPLTPDPSSFPVPHPRSRSVSPKPMIIDLTGVKGGTDSSSEEKTFDKSPISPACLSPRDFHRTPSRESGGETGGFLTPRYCPSPSSSSPRNELKRDHAFDRSPSPLLKVAWRDSGRSSNNSSVSESSLSCSRDDNEGDSQIIVPTSPSPLTKQVTHSPSATSSTASGGLNATAGRSSSPIVNGFRSRRGSEGSRSSSEDKRNPKINKVQSATNQDSRDSMTPTSHESRDSLMSRDSTRDEVNNESSLDDVFNDSISDSGGANDIDRRNEGYLGVLDFSLLYDSHSQSLHCTLHSAKDLKPLDSTSAVDAYVKLNLLPGASKSNKLKTQVVPKSVHPDFNETLTYYGISDHDMARKTLRLMVLDAERFKHDFLGEIRIPLKTLIPHEARRFRKHLEQKTNLAEDESKEFELGKILLSLKYSSQRGALVVGVVRCAHLPSMDANGFSDPYVKVQLKQAKIVQKKFKTTVKWRNLNPEFNEEFAFEMKRNELPKKTLEVRVFDKDVGRMDDFIGGVIFSHESGGSAIRHWYDVINYPDRRHDRWHTLQNIK